MAFHYTSRSIVLDGRSLLKAECRDRDGHYRPATLNLDRCLGNDNGTFAWGGVNFSRSARNVSLMFPFLSAELRDCQGRWHDAEVDLAQRVENVNGALRYEWGGSVGSALDEAANDLQRLIFSPLERTASDLLGLGSDEEPRREEPAREMGGSTPSHAGSRQAETGRNASVRGDQTPTQGEPPAASPLVDMESLSGSEISERVLRFLFEDCTSPRAEYARRVHTVKRPNGGISLELGNGPHTFSHPLSEDKVQSIQAEHDRVFFDMDEHLDRGIKLEDGEKPSNVVARESANPLEAQELEVQKKAAKELQEHIAKDDEAAQLRHEAESVDTESRLDTPDFSDGEDEWVMAK